MIHNDHLGTPQKMTDASGTVVWSADYKPFGEATITVSTITNKLRFPGQYYDQETALHYNYFRDYNPSVGRYVEKDPIGFESGDLNLYSYSSNDPIDWNDQWGLARYVILVGDPGLGPHNAGQNFVRAANTQAQALTAQGHTVTVVNVSNVQQFNTAITTGSLINGGVIYFGHGWIGTLYIGQSSAPGTNLNSFNISQLSNSNLSATAIVNLNSCNSGSGNNPIAQQIANQLQRTAYGFNRPLGFTGSPGVYLHGSNAFPPSAGPLYMVPVPGGRSIQFQPQRR